MTGLGLLVLAATADPVPMLSRSQAPPTGRPPGPLATASATASGPNGTPTPDQITPYDASWVRPLVLGVLIVVGAVVLLGTAVAVVQMARRLWEDRWQAPGVARSIGGDQLEVDLTSPGQAIVDAAEQMAQALRSGSPRNAVVQCWLVLVRSLEQHGVTPDPAHSPTELTRAALTQLSTDARAADELTSLFLEARFSEHLIGELERQRALSALQRVVSGLDGTRGAESRSVPVGGAS